MICFLEGGVVEKQPARVVLQVAGVGYEVFIPLSSYDRLPSQGGTCRLLIYDCIREDAHDLYGFATAEERRIFLLLLGVSGIGPKTALNALSGLSPREMTAAIAGNDLKRLSSISGIGRKTAERIVVELRDKITAGEALEAVSGGEGTPEDSRRRDAVLALIALGYKQIEAIRLVRAAVPEASSSMGVEEIVRLALLSSR
ncbi:MAG: Holliday junction branch migration protein RuvA [Kiritimatiellia bacterium]|nr:Holliday junction branch migration protein RuvA [Kiritimatiellia bacterium]